MTPSPRDIENAAAALTMFGNLTTDAGLSAELHQLAQSILPDNERTESFPDVVRDWGPMLRSRFRPRGDDR